MIYKLCRHGPNLESNHGADVTIVATFMVKEMLYKDHLDVFRGALSQTSVDNIIRRSLQQFGITHELQDIEDLNRLLTWVIYGRYGTFNVAELNAVAALDSPMGGFINLREKIERDFSQYFVVGGAESSEAHSKSDMTDTQLANEEKATVKLAHSSITRYFRRSEDVEIPGKNIAIGIRKETAELAITKTCLLALCNKETRSQADPLYTDVQPIIDYAVRHLGTHLNAITWFYNSLGLEDKIFLASYLTRLAREEALWRGYWFLNDTFQGRQYVLIL